MEDDDLTVGKSSNSLRPFRWKSFKHIKRDYNLYREYLGSKIVILNHTNTAFKKNPDGSIGLRPIKGWGHSYNPRTQDAYAYIRAAYEKAQDKGGKLGS